MAFASPDAVPTDACHLSRDEVRRLDEAIRLVEAGEHGWAHDVLEELWIEATDVHKDLFRGLVNAVGALCARRLGHRRGAREIAARSRATLRRFPRHSLGLDLDTFLDDVNAFLAAGDGPVRLRKPG